MKSLLHFTTIVIFISIIQALFSIPIQASAEAISVSARAAIVYSPADNRIIYSKEPYLRLPMASTTKIMTALIAIENLQDDEMIVIPDEATGIEGSSIYLKTGESLSAQDLLYSLMLRSANDAAEALAYAVSSDIYEFSNLMNARAEELGLENTHFDNPHGLDSENHYTTAYDLAIISANALRNERFKQICSTLKYRFSTEGGERIVTNHNKLLNSYDGAIGIKTGYTKKCGRCLVSAAERNGLTLICVTLNAPNDWTDHKKLLDYGFSIYNL